MNVATGRLKVPWIAEAHESDRRKRPSRRTLRLRMHCSLVLLDLLCIVGSFWLASFIYNASGGIPLTTIFMFLPLYFVSAFGARAFSVEVIGHAPRAIGRSLRSLVIGALAVLFVAFCLKSSADFSRVVFSLGFAICVVSLIASRWLFIRRARAILGGNPYSIYLITDEEVSESHREHLSILPASRFDPELDCPEMYHALAQALRDADRVVVRCKPDQRLAWANLLKGANVQAEILAPELFETQPIAIAKFEQTPTIVVGRGPLSLPDRIAKRVFDLAVAGSALLLLAPLMMLIALAIKLESRGPVLFIQARIGRSNHQFRMFKFRSMLIESSDGHGVRSTSRGDKRITAIGRLIRKTSLDELPQLFNILLGDMSVVGPRPHAVGSRAENLLFWEIDSRYWHRHAAKPGLTGLAQVRGFRGATEQRADLINRLQADLEYLHRWTLWRDIQIIGQTFSVVMHKNAY